MRDFFVSRRFFLFLFLLILVISIPITIIQLRKQQKTQSGAAGEAVSFSLNPTNATIPIGNSSDVQLLLDTKTNRVTGVDIKLAYDTRIVDLTFTPSSAFNEQIINSAASGVLRYAAVDISGTPATGNALIGTIHMQAKQIGIVTLEVQKVQVVAEKVSGALPVGSQSILGSYTVAIAPTATPIPTSTPIPTPTSTPIPTPTNTPVPTSTPIPTDTPIPPTPTSGVCEHPAPPSGCHYEGVDVYPQCAAVLVCNPTPTNIPTSTPVPTSTPPVPTSTTIPTPTSITPVTGDANGDGTVDIRDFNDWRTEYLGVSSTKTADFNNDGTVDIIDFNDWRTEYLKI